MPAGTKVNEVYQALLKKGYSKEKAARIAQSQTGEALATGRPPKHAVKAANEPPSRDLTTPSSERTTEAQAENKGRKRTRSGSGSSIRLMNAGYTLEDARPHADKVLKIGEKSPGDAKGSLEKAEKDPDSYLAPGGITGRTGKLWCRIRQYREGPWPPRPSFRE